MAWPQLGDPSWNRIESVFGLQASQSTPPIRPLVTEPPPAPRKLLFECRNQQQLRRENLMPRKLTFEPENQRRVEICRDKDSGITIWSSTSSSLLAEDADKENRPENDNNIIPNSQEGETVKPGSLKYRLEQLMNRFSIKNHPQRL